MMSYLKIMLLCWIPMSMVAQTDGIRFEERLSWQEIQAKAKRENRFIFMDCVTTWCVPCKMMEKQVFSDPAVGAFMNEQFISIQVQMDKTAGDSEATKSWYADAEKLSREYGIVAYPTLLYFSPEGKLVHRVVGGKDISGFVAAGKDALRPETQYHTQIEAFEQATRKSASDYLRLSLAARAVFDGERANAYAAAYLAMEEDLLTKEGITLLGSITNTSKDEHFSLLLAHEEKIDEIMGQGFTGQKVVSIILQEEVYPKVPVEEGLDWEELTERLVALYPNHAQAVVAKFRLQYYSRFEDWDQLDDAVDAYLQRFANHLNAEDWNRLALTYYKLDKDERAIYMQEQAVSLAEGPMKDGFTDLLSRMRAGDRSWLQQ